MRPFIFAFVIGTVLIIIAAFVYITASSSRQVGSSETKSEQITPAIPEGWELFTNSDMNITFAYPPTFRHTQVEPLLVSLSDPAHLATEDAMLIYSTTTSKNANDFDVAVPYPISGELKQTRSFQMGRFQAVTNIYSDKNTPTQILMMKQGTQAFVIRYPAHQAIDQEVLKQIISSIGLEH